MPKPIQEFHYYRNRGSDWTDKELVLVVEAETITQADEMFQEKTGTNPSKDASISVTLGPLEISQKGNGTNDDHRD